jgi:hypothetical protein
MQNEIIKFIEDLKNRRMSLDSLDEASTRQAIIGRVLHLLGWDIFNVDEVVPEYPVGDTKIDYALKTGRYNDKLFIEVKRIREDLARHQEQLLGYCFKEGVNFAILTNGIVWWFYLPLRQSSWEERRFYAIDIVQQESKDVASKLIEFLSRDNITNGNAIKNAELMYVSKDKDNVLNNTLPKAWDKMIVEGNSRLIELIGDVTENLCGFKPDTGTIKRFLSGHEYHLRTIGVGIQPSKDPIPPEVQQTKDQNIAESPPIEGKQVATRNKNTISSFYFLGSKYDVDTWKALLMKILEIMYSKHGGSFNKVLDMPGRKRQYFSYDPLTLGTAAKFGDTNIYVEVKLGHEGIVRLCYDVIKLFGYSDDDLKIEKK